MSELLKPWWQIAQSHRDIRQRRLDQTMFAVD